MRPRLLDLFCGAGGASAGYVAAGFDVVGVDAEPMPDYPHDFVRADAMTFPLEGYDAIHASPPCHEHSALNAARKIVYGTGWMLAATRDRLEAHRVTHGTPWVIENVPGAPINKCHAIMLCGSMFGCRTEMPGYGEVWLRRHRWFESSVLLMNAARCSCHGRKNIGVYGHGSGSQKRRVRGPGTAKASREVMGIDWMRRDELDEAIPPAYTKFVGDQILWAIHEQETSRVWLEAEYETTSERSAT